MRISISAKCIDDADLRPVKSLQNVELNEGDTMEITHILYLDVSDKRIRKTACIEIRAEKPVCPCCHRKL